ncbi:MAG: ATP-dependent 6-phosphofructokinase, partial [Phycisphaerae bacterium]|nr:ATP-dependent 6-phosphofructokinase [Phycisphaerae bacterium]
MSIAGRLVKRGMPMVGVPKTIDNDVWGTELTFGFHTAVQTATEALDRLHSTASAHHRVMIAEVMGRYAGWIALTAGVASGADVVLIPEIPYDIDAVCRQCTDRSKRGKRFSIICVAEGARPKGGRMVVKRRVASSTDPIRLGGVGKVLASQIEGETGIESRVTVLGYLQRGGTPTAFDRMFATQLGHHAAHLLKTGKVGRMVALKAGRLSDVALESVTGKTRKVPAGSPLVAAARAVGTAFGD